MNHLNSRNHTPIFSQYRGPHILNLALTAEEEAAAKEKQEADDAAEAARLKKEEDDAAAAKAAADAADEDPLQTPNPFEEGSTQHQAFEKQREKFKVKLDKERTAAAEAASAALGGKLDELLGTVRAAIPPKAAVKADPKPANKATDEDVAIVNDAMARLGIDPAEFVQTRRRQEVNAALTQLRSEYPGVEFNDLELVTFANENGISQLGGAAYDILQLAFVRKFKDKLTAAPVTVTTTPAKKKEPVKVLAGGTKSTPLADPDKPQGIAGWKNRIMKKYSKAA